MGVLYTFSDSQLDEKKTTSPRLTNYKYLILTSIDKLHVQLLYKKFPLHARVSNGPNKAIISPWRLLNGRSVPNLVYKRKDKKREEETYLGGSSEAIRGEADILALDPEALGPHRPHDEKGQE